MTEKLVREFDTGGKRDTEEGKLDLEGYLSPLVLRAFGEYMLKHQTMRDGSKRESDNWQKGFGDKHYDVCMKSMFRHFTDVWYYHRATKRNYGMSYKVLMIESLCALMFNVMAYLHKILEIDDYNFLEDYIRDIKKIPGSKAGELE